ncbi:MAG: hypothetical protein V4560_07475 [Bacteroidota bacterium]
MKKDQILSVAIERDDAFSMYQSKFNTPRSYLESLPMTPTR